MKGRVLEVIAYLARRHEPGGGSIEPSVELREELLDAGFEEEDVERALGWLGRVRQDRLAVAWTFAAPRRSHRVVTADEGLRLCAEARGFLFRLERAGILDEELREAVYDRVRSLDLPTVGVEEVRVLVALLLKACPGSDDALVSCAMEGDLAALYH